MQALRIEFTLNGHVGEMAYPLHLDSLLAFAQTEVNNGDWRNLVLPLEKADDVYKGSALLFERDGASLFTRYKRMEKSIFIDGIGKYTYTPGKTRYVETAGGQYKGSVINTPVFYSHKAVAYCIGNKGKIIDLLKHIRTLGPLAKLGLGRIININVVEDKSALTRWEERVLPWCPSKDLYYPVHAAFTFPYWDVCKMKDCWIHHSVA